MKDHINLFQPDLLEGRGRGEGSSQKWLLALFLLPILVFSGFYLQDARKRTALKKEVEAMIQQRDQLHQKLASFITTSLSADHGKGNVPQNPDIESILKERVLWSRVLQEVSLIAPEGVWMTQFETDTTQGVRFEGFAVSYRKVTDFIAALESSPVFQDVLLDFSRQNQGERKVDFSIHAHLRKGGWLLDRKEG